MVCADQRTRAGYRDNPARSGNFIVTNDEVVKAAARRSRPASLERLQVVPVGDPVDKAHLDPGSAHPAKEVPVMGFG